MTGAADAAPPTTSRSAASGLASAIWRYLPAVIVFLVVIVAWETIAANSSRRIIPAPTSIAAAISRESELLWRAAQATYFEAIGGLIIGTLAGVLVGFATARWAVGRDILVPIAVGASTIPLIAIAPIINNWFGLLNPLSKMMMAALLVFFPVVINVTRGLVEVQPAQLELMRSYATTPAEVLRKVRIPNMLPFLFTALKVASTLAFIGALVGEYFGGTSAVIGRVVLTSMSSGSLDLAWAGILIGSLGAIIAYLVVTVAERLLIPWHTAVSADGS